MNIVRDILPSLEYNELCGIIVQDDNTLENYKITDITVDGGNVVFHINEADTEKLDCMIRDLANDFIIEHGMNIVDIVKSEISKTISSTLEDKLHNIDSVFITRLADKVMEINDGK